MIICMWPPACRRQYITSICFRSSRYDFFRLEICSSILSISRSMSLACFFRSFTQRSSLAFSSYTKTLLFTLDLQSICFCMYLLQTEVHLLQLTDQFILVCYNLFTELLLAVQSISQIQWGLFHFSIRPFASDLLKLFLAGLGLVFQLISPYRIKLYIFSVNTNFTEIQFQRLIVTEGSVSLHVPQSTCLLQLCSSVRLSGIYSNLNVGHQLQTITL